MCVAEVQTRVFNAFVTSAFSSAYSSVRKSLVARCLCAWLKFDRVFSMRSSPARLHCLQCSSPEQNEFVASDKRICLQCNIVFGGEMSSI